MKAHTQQPARTHGKATPHQPDIFYVIGWLVFPALLVFLAIYRWRTMKARMGYRTVRYDTR